MLLLSLSAELGGVPDIRGRIEVDSGRRDVPLPGGAGSPPGPAPQLLGRLALRHRNLEVRTRPRFLQGPHAVSPTCNA